MFSKRQVLPEVTDNLDDFVKKLLSRTTDDSEQGRTSFIAAILRAKQRYEGPINSKTSGWLYQYFRIRGSEVENAISQVEAFPEIYNPLDIIKQIVGNGEWNKNSSYNYYFFVELIKSVPGYKPLEKELFHPILLKIKNKVLDQIDYLIAQYKAELKMIDERKKEREEIQQSQRKINERFDNIALIFNNLELAQTSAKENPSKIHFSLTFNNVWQLSWIDFQGKTHKLDMNQEQISTLSHVNSQEIELKNSLRIKKLCVQVRDLFLDKVQLIVNPKNPVNYLEINNETLIEKGVVSTFVLRGKPHAYSLYWLNTLGKINEISLDKYSEFKQWLNDQDPSLEQLTQLKAYLLNVKTSTSINAVKGMDNFKIKLQQSLSGGPCSAIPKCSKPPEHTIKSLDLSLYANIAKSLTRNNGGVVETSTTSIETEHAPTRLNLDKYAMVSKLFSKKESIVIDASVEIQAFTALPNQ